MTIAPNRAVAVLTPLVLAPLAGSISVLAAKYMPGVEIDSEALQGIFITGATIAFAKAALWLKGWQDHEKREDGAQFAAGLEALDEPDADDDDLVDMSDAAVDDDLLDPDFDPDVDLDQDDDLADPTQPVTAGAAG